MRGEEYSQLSHLCRFCARWIIRLWRVRLPFSANDISQRSHLCGRSPKVAGLIGGYPFQLNRRPFLRASLLRDPVGPK